MTFGIGDLLLVALGSIFVGVWLVVRASRERRRRPLARLMAFVLEPVFYWFDLYGPDGRPSHTKTAYFITLLVLLYGEIRFGLEEIEARRLDWGFVAYTLVVCTFAFGRTAYLGFLHSKLGDKLADFMAPEKDREQAMNHPGKIKPPGMEAGDYDGPETR